MGALPSPPRDAPRDAAAFARPFASNISASTSILSGRVPCALANALSASAASIRADTGAFSRLSNRAIISSVASIVRYDLTSSVHVCLTKGFAIVRIASQRHDSKTSGYPSRVFAYAYSTSFITSWRSRSGKPFPCTRHTRAIAAACRSRSVALYSPWSSSSSLA